MPFCLFFIWFFPMNSNWFHFFLTQALYIFSLFVPLVWIFLKPIDWKVSKRLHIIAYNQSTMRPTPIFILFIDSIRGDSIEKCASQINPRIQRKNELNFTSSTNVLFSIFVETRRDFYHIRPTRLVNRMSVGHYSLITISFLRIGTQFKYF